LLRVLNLEAGYGRIRVLKGVCVEIEEGEIRVLSPSSGSIEYDGTPIQRKSPSARVKKGLVLVPEGRRILRRMTVNENLLMGTYARSDRSGVRRDLKEVFNRFPVLAQRRHLSADVLSGGEQQMLAIGRALVAHPRLLMMDEPSLGLSPLLVKEIFMIITDLHKSGITILLVEQNALEALHVADRGYVMETGKIVMADSAQGLLSSDMLREAYLGSEGEGK